MPTKRTTAAATPTPTPTTERRPPPSSKDAAARKAAIKATMAAAKSKGIKEDAISPPKTTRKELAKKRPKPQKPEKKTCGAKKRGNNEPCQQPPGFRTTHPGYGKCWMHGGNSPGGIKAAEKEMVNERMAAEGALYGGKRDIGPQEALLEEVQRTAGHVVWLEQKIRSLKEDDLVQHTAKDGMKESEWIKMYQDERKMLVAVCNTAIRCGIAERQVRIVEEQGKMIATMLLKLINDSALDLSPQQRLVAPKLCRNLLMELSSGETVPTNNVMIGNEIVDAELVDAP